MVDEHPLPWLAPLLNGVEHANFFETRATEYSKAATRGDWDEVWDNFDRRQKAKGDAANDAPAQARATATTCSRGRGGGGVIFEGVVILGLPIGSAASMRSSI